MISNLPFPCRVTRHTRRLVPPFQDAGEDQRSDSIRSFTYRDRRQGSRLSPLLWASQTRMSGSLAVNIESVNVTCEMPLQGKGSCACFLKKAQPGPSHGATRLVIHPAKGKREGPFNGRIRRELHVSCSAPPAPFLIGVLGPKTK